MTAHTRHGTPGNAARRGLAACAGLRPVAALFYRHYLVWTRRLAIFLCMYIVGPTIMLYGLNAAFGVGDRLGFILPGIIANSVAAGGFINCAFGGMERLMNKRYDSWLAATMSVPQVVAAEALFQGFKGLVVACGIWVAGGVMGGGFDPLPLLGSLAPMALLGWTAAMLGYCVAAAARNFSDIELSEPFLTAAFVFSGVFVSITHFAWPLQVFGMLLPIYHGIAVMRPMFTGGLDPALAALHLGILLAMAAVATAAAIHLFKRRLAGG